MTSISFAGDIAFSKYFKDHWQKEFIDDNIIEFLNASNHVVANVECPLTNFIVAKSFLIYHCSKKF